MREGLPGNAEARNDEIAPLVVFKRKLGVHNCDLCTPCLFFVAMGYYLQSMIWKTPSRFEILAGNASK